MVVTFSTNTKGDLFAHCEMGLVIQYSVAEAIMQNYLFPSGQDSYLLSYYPLTKTWNLIIGLTLTTIEIGAFYDL